MVKRLRVADPLPWLLLIGGLFASLLILPLSLFQSESFSDARTSSYNEWICGHSSSPPRSASKPFRQLSAVWRRKGSNVLMQSAGLALRMT